MNLTSTTIAKELQASNYDLIVTIQLKYYILFKINSFYNLNILFYF
jgi:hypothetical protein